MNSDEVQQRIDELFDRASSLPVERQAAFLDEECGSDPPDVREEVEKLLRVYAETPPGRPPPFPGFQQGSRVPPRDPMIGRQVGNYLIRRRLGQGGFGAVYLAERKGEFQRKVALKLIRPDRVSEEKIIERFELERRVLADLQHENIARLFDGGTTEEGWPFFVMEYVEGQPVTEYCDAKKMPVHDRLLLFQKVCAAVKFAHDFGYIHRDIKPSNVLVTSDGVPKLLDFGIAKLIDPRSRSRLVSITEDGIPGTPEYASPEQIRGERKNIGTGTDVYSLGVVLYELLTGHHPYDFRSRIMSEIERVICEEEPHLPSTVVLTPLGKVTEEGTSQLASAEQLSEVRQTTPPQLRKTLSGDLENVVLQALHKDWNRRYNSPAAFSEDIDNYLKGLPIRARPDSAIYRAKKFAMRNRGPVIAAVLLLGSLLAGTSVATVLWIRAESNAADARNFAEKEREALGEAEAKSRELDRQLRLATGLRLIGESRDVQKQFPVRSLLLAIEALEISQGHTETILPIAHERLLNAVSIVGGRPLTGHEAPIRFVEISPDGRWLVTGPEDKTARLWDLTAENPADSSLVLRGHEDMIWSVTISPDGRWLVTGSGDKTARLWDLTAENPADSSLVLRGHEGGVRSVTINGRWLVTGSDDGTGWTARLWDLTAGNPAESSLLLRGRGRFWSVTMSADGHWLVIDEHDNHDFSLARLWDLTAEDPADSSHELGGHDWGISSVTISADGRWLVTHDHDMARLWDLATEDPADSSLVLRGHDGAILSATISPDGRWLVTGSYGKTARLWDLTAENPADSSLVLRGHDRNMWSVTISPDSRWLVTGSEDKTARLWDLTAENPADSSLVLRGHDGAISSATISPDGRWLVTGSRDNTARVWDLAAENPADSSLVLRGHDGDIWSVTISPDSRWLVTGSADKTARLWDLTAENPANSWKTSRANVGIPSLTISPDSRWLVTRSYGKTARLWDLTAENPANSSLVLRGHDSNLWSVTISPDSRWLVTGSEDKTARLWDLTGENPADSSLVLRGHDGAISSVTISPDGRWLVTGSDDKTARLWDLTTENPADSSLVLRGNEGEAPSVTISPDGRWLVTGSRENTVARVWDLAAENPADSSLVLRGNETTCRDGRWLVTRSSDDGTVRLWDLTSENPANSSLDFGTNLCAISPDGGWLVTQSEDKSARLWDLTAENPADSSLVLRGHDGKISYILLGTGVTISPDGRWLVIGNLGKTAGVWDLTAENPADSSLVLRGGEYTAWTDTIISPDGRWVVTVSAPGMTTDKTVRLWDLTAENPADSVVLRGHEDTIWPVTISPDGHWLVTGSRDKTVRLWDLTAENPAASSRVLRGHESTIVSLVISPDGRWLVTGSDDDAARLWDLDMDSLLNRARQIAGRKLTPEERKQYYLLDDL